MQLTSVFDLLSPLTGLTAGKTVFIQILQSSLFVNLALMAFNLFPIAPLDGSNILQMFIPHRYMSRYEDIMRVGPFILLFLIFFETFLPVHLLTGWVFGIMSFALSIFSAVAGMVGL
ncbi:site-2 protease family protein [Candidatus Peregrinibacteria bacterium]|nr:site-2 protease family protein [Candidatus Peregrinibacteria bacterium]